MSLRMSRCGGASRATTGALERAGLIRDFCGRKADSSSAVCTVGGFGEAGVITGVLLLCPRRLRFGVLAEVGDVDVSTAVSMTTEGVERDVRREFLVRLLVSGPFPAATVGVTVVGSVGAGAIDGVAVVALGVILGVAGGGGAGFATAGVVAVAGPGVG